MLIVKNSVENVDELLLTYEKDQGLVGQLRDDYSNEGRRKKAGGNH